jgi:hypothetical protein
MNIDDWVFYIFADSVISVFKVYQFLICDEFQFQFLYYWVNDETCPCLNRYKYI